MGSPNREGDRAGNALQPNPVYSPTESLAVTARRLAAVRDAGVPAIAPGRRSAASAPSSPTGGDDARGSDPSAAAAARRSQRARRQSTRYPVQRYGDWFTGDDTELDRKLADYNLDVPEGSPAAQAQASRRAARRQSWLAKTRGLRPGDAALEPREGGAAGREHNAVARSVQSVTEQLCSQLDELVPAAEKSDDEAPGQPSLRQQLVASWNGKVLEEGWGGDVCIVLFKCTRASKAQKSFTPSPPHRSRTMSAWPRWPTNPSRTAHLMGRERAARRRAQPRRRTRSSSRCHACRPARRPRMTRLPKPPSQRAT